MLVLMVMFIFALGVAFFATQNTNGVTVVLANTPISGIPMYIIVLASILVGLFMAWIISLVDAIASFFTLRGKDSTIAATKTRIRELENKVHDLEIENTRLREHKVHDTRPTIRERLAL